MTSLDKKPRAGATQSGLKSGVFNTMSRRVGGTSLLYRQLHQGVPVFAGEFVITLDGSNALLSINGEIASDVTVSVTPQVTQGEAEDIALLAVAKWHKLDLLALQVSKPTLFVYDSRLLKPGVVIPGLVWQVEVTTSEVAPVRELVLVDAHGGQITLHVNQVHTAKNRKTHDAGGMGALPATLVCTEAGPFPACAAANAGINSAHAHAGDAYDF